MRHLYANFNDQFKGLILKNLLWKAATTSIIPEFNSTIEEMKKENKEAFICLWKVEKVNWTRSHFPMLMPCDLICNNISEAFNKFILEATEKPIVTMLEMIRRILTRMFQTKKVIASKILP